MKKQTIFTAFNTGVKFDTHVKGPQLKFLEEAMKICPSNVLIGQIIGKSNLAVCNARHVAKQKGIPGILEAHNFGLVNAYKKYAQPLLALAKSIPVAINHKGYQTIIEVSRNLKPLDTTKEISTDVSGKRINSWTDNEMVVIRKYANMLGTGQASIEVIVTNAFDEIKQFGKGRTEVGIRSKLYDEKSKMKNSVSLQPSLKGKYGNSWQDEELDILRKFIPLLGKIPTNQLYREAHNALIKAGYTSRTEKAVEIRLYILKNKGVPLTKKTQVLKTKEEQIIPVNDELAKVKAMKDLGAKKITIGDMIIEF
jgi:hypothetical protein